MSASTRDPVTAPRVERLRCEHLLDPRGVDRPQPRLSWQVRADRRGTTQQAYQVLAASSPSLLRDAVGDLWDSGKVLSAESVLVPFGGASLPSRQQVFWSVRVWDDEDVVSSYAPAATFELGLLSAQDWQAEWIAAVGGEPSSVSYLRSRLHVSAPVRKSRAYITALGLYELRCNGSRVGDARFTPGWTDYAQRLQYQVLDLTDLLVDGDNEIEVLLADGWYAGYVGFEGTRGHYGDTPALLAQIEVDTADGRLVHATGEGWTCTRGPIRTSDMLKGEAYDETVPAAAAAPVRLATGTSAVRVVSPAPPVRVLATVPAVTVERVGELHRIDFGQNLVGWVRLRVDASAATTTLTVRHAEIRHDDGSLYVESLRTATATDTYVLTGGGVGVRVLEPTFTFHGFRYAEVSGYEGHLTAGDVTAVVCGSDLEPVGEFACSDEAVTQLHSNIVWSARGNFLDIPTDCPQRDERMGWTGDAQVFAPTACYLFDTAAFFTKWLGDVRDGQSSDGSFSNVAPRVLLPPEGAPGWADAGVIVPWVLWERYGDRELLAQMYPAMCRWVEYVHRANPDLLWAHARGADYGDWLAAHAETDKDLIATAYFARSASLTARAAEALGLDDDARKLHQLAEGIVAAFQRAYLLPDGQLSSGTQTSYALALRFGLIPADLCDAAAGHLADDVVAHGTHLTTGFLGVGQLLPALSDAGHTSLAHRLLLQDDYPSWLHAVRSGATTIWERWDGWTREHGFGNPVMNSYNHYALGSVGEWLYSGLAGIRYDEPGGRRITLAPLIDDALTWALARHVTPYGVVECGWERGEDGSARVDVEVPVGVEATLRLPVELEDVRESGRLLDDREDVTVLQDGGLSVVSGRYRFEPGDDSGRPR